MRDLSGLVGPRSMKVLRELWLWRSRVVMMALAIAVSLVAVGSVLAAGAIVGREMPRNYLGTAPASATLETTGVTPDILAAVRALPNVADVTARHTVTARVRIGDRWRPMTLFTADAADPMTVARFDLEQGSWPAATGTVLLERSGLEMLGVADGDTIRVRVGADPPRDLEVTGVVHDASLAPSWQENTGYGYVTPATIAALGGDPSLDEVRLVVASGADDAAAINATAQDVAAWLAGAGHPVSEIRIPPPLQHPHQWQVTVVLGMLLAFGIAAVVLASILVASIVAALLAEQVRQVGVLKAIGARTVQVASMYVLLPLAVGVAAALLAIIPSVLVGRGLAGAVAELLNLDLVDESIPAWVFLVVIGAGVVLPVVASLIPILRASRTSVRDAIDDYGIRPEGGRLGQLAARIGTSPDAGRPDRIGRPTLLAVRNAIRRPVRTLLTVAMLGFGGAILLTSLNSIGAWNRTIDQGLATRHYDLELRLASPQPADAVTGIVGAVPGVASVQAWGAAPTALVRPREVDVVRTYPDRGHGSFTLVGLDPGTTLIDFPVLEGRWLLAGDLGTVVLNQTAAAALPGVGVGDRIELRTAGRVATWTVAGVVQELGSPAMAYATSEAFGTSVAAGAAASLVRIALEPGASPTGVLDQVEVAVAGAGIPVALSLTTAELRGAIDQHVMVLLAVLVLTAILVAIVGLLGLAATMSINVVERTREIGILLAIGALPRTILRLVTVEGLAIGAASIPLAIVLSVPLSAAVGSVIGSLSFRVPLVLDLSPTAALAWVVAVVVGSLVATAVPARIASRLPVREALAYT